MKSLKSIIITSIFSLTLLGSVVFLLIAITFSNKAIKDVYTSDVEEMTRIVANVAADENKLRLDLISDLSSLPSIRSSSTSMQEKQIQLKEIAAKDDAMIEIYLCDIYGITTDFDGNEKFIAARPDFVQARSGSASLYGPVYSDELKKLVIYYSVPVYDENNEIQWIMTLTSEGQILSDICRDYSVCKTYHPFIVDKNTIDLYGDVDETKIQERFNYRNEAKNSKYNGLFEDFNRLAKEDYGICTYTENGKKFYFAFSAIENTSFSVVTIIPSSELSSRTRGMKLNMLIFALVLLILGIVLSLILANATNPLKVVGNTIVSIGSGNADLTQRLEIRHVKKEIGEVVSGFNTFVEKLQEIIASVRESENVLSDASHDLQVCSQETSGSINQILGNIQNMTSGIQKESDSVNETASAVHQISANIQSLENMIESQAKNVEEATAAVEEMVGNISSVNNSVSAMVDSFKLLQENADIGIQTQANVNERLQKIEEDSQMLLEANSVISAIAEQTNLLAMNAAIEAAHAGEAGKGFSVVADEIRKLSETSSDQSSSIGEELTSIQASINYVVEESNKASQAFGSVAENISKTDEVIHMIKSAMEEQQIGSKQITDSLFAMNNSTSEVKQAAKEMAAGNEQILNEIQVLQNVTDSVNGSISEMENGARNIDEAGQKLEFITENVTSSVQTIHGKIGQFKV